MTKKIFYLGDQVSFIFAGSKEKGIIQKLYSRGELNYAKILDKSTGYIYRTQLELLIKL